MMTLHDNSDLTLNAAASSEEESSLMNLLQNPSSAGWIGSDWFQTWLDIARHQ